MTIIRIREVSFLYIYNIPLSTHIVHNMKFSQNIRICSDHTSQWFHIVKHPLQNIASIWIYRTSVWLWQSYQCRVCTFLGYLSCDICCHHFHDNFRTHFSPKRSILLYCVSDTVSLQKILSLFIITLYVIKAIFMFLKHTG